MTITNAQGRFELNNGVQMPYLGLGVFECENNSEVIHAVEWALDAGYRHIDTASIYRNEAGVGAGIRHSGMNREDIFVVSKVWNSDQGYDSTKHAFETSLNLLELDYLDLYLIHWPVKGKFIDTWRALEYLYREKRVRAIGVSNFMQHHLESLLNEAEVVPMVNQMEFHPYLVQQDLLDYCRSKSIQYESWSPLMKGRVLEVDLLKELAAKYKKTIVQVVLRWNLQKGVVTIPKSSRKDRIVSNADLFDFYISEEDMHRIDRLDRNLRVGPDPNNFNF